MLITVGLWKEKIEENKKCGSVKTFDDNSPHVFTYWCNIILGPVLCVDFGVVIDKNKN